MPVHLTVERIATLPVPSRANVNATTGTMCCGDSAFVCCTAVSGRPWCTTACGGAQDVTRTTEWSMPKRGGTARPRPRRNHDGLTAKPPLRTRRGRRPRKSADRKQEMSKAQKPSTTASRRQKERLVRKARRTERSKAATDSAPGEAKSPSTAAFSKKPESRWFLPEVLDRTVIAIPC